MNQETVKTILKQEIKLDEMKRNIKKEILHFSIDDESDYKVTFLVKNPLHLRDTFKLKERMYNNENIQQCVKKRSPRQ